MEATLGRRTDATLHASLADRAYAAIRDQLLPLADIATPNQFELQWLTGRTDPAEPNAAAAARALGRPRVVVTSAASSRGGIATLLVEGNAEIERRQTLREKIPNGPGDLFAGLMLGHLINGLKAEAALDATLAALDRVLAASSGHDVLQLAALAGPRP